MNEQEQQPTQNKAKGYGKRSMLQWVVIYLVAAAVVYGLIYYLFIRDTGTSGIY